MQFISVSNSIANPNLTPIPIPRAVSTSAPLQTSRPKLFSKLDTLNMRYLFSAGLWRFIFDSKNRNKAACTSDRSRKKTI